MTKWNVADRRSRSTVPEKTQIHAIWRGIGCLLMLITPVISFILAGVTVNMALALGWPMPYQLLGMPVMPDLLWSSPALVPVLGLIQSQANLYAILLVTVSYIVLLSAVVSLGYAIMYRIVGPSRYGPLDAPPPKVKARSYRR
jgi:hypothetical protein